MQSLDNNYKAFFVLLRAGLWEQKARLSDYGPIDFGLIHRIAVEQSVVGLVTAGLEHISDITIPKSELLTFIGSAIRIEESNKAMNSFILKLMELLRKEKIMALLVKGQGIAQCYERPLWRSCGDVDLFIDRDNYKRTRAYLSTIADTIENESIYNLHQAFSIESWEVELHGTLRSGLGRRIDKVIDEVQYFTFSRGKTRVWKNNDKQIFLPEPDSDVVFVFVHILQHFFRGGIGLRQVCDWCRLLWIFRDSINRDLLERRLRNAALMSEWMAFGALAVQWLGMPSDAMPLYSDSNKWKKKATKVLAFMLETGNFGYNRDMSYHNKYPFIIIKAISLWQATVDGIKRFCIFPLDAFRIWWKLFFEGMSRALKGQS